MEKKSLSDLRDLLVATTNVPQDEAHCLPGILYTNPDYFQYEMDVVLSREWHCLGRVDEIPSAGDYFTATLLNEPLLIVRKNDLDIAVLSNVCRHRGMQVASGSGNKKTFSCPYHAWRYSRDGKLLSAPRMDMKKPEFADCRLPEFRCEIWNGFIYVNLDPDTEPLSPRLQKLGSLLQNYGTEDMRLIACFEEEWHTNWKCLIENFSESYHLSVVHPKTLHPYTPTALSRKSLSDDNFTAYVANYPDSAGARGHGSADLRQEERLRSTLFCLFPTHLVSQAATLLASFSVQPIAVNRIQVKWTLSTYQNDLTDKEIGERIDLWQQVNREDRDKLEKMQISLGSRHAPSGPLAVPDYEGTLWDFYQYLLRKEKASA